MLLRVIGAILLFIFGSYLTLIGSLGTFDNPHGMGGRPLFVLVILLGLGCFGLAVRVLVRNNRPE